MHRIHYGSGLFLLGLSGLLLQVALTRLSSAALNYHLTFLVIGAALLGTSAGGTWVAVRWPDAIDHQTHRRRLSRLILASAGAMILIGAAFSWVPLRTLGSASALIAILFAYPLLALPYALQGAVSAISLREVGSRTHRIYAAALAGAAAGCAVAVVAIDAVGPRWVVSLAAIVALIAVTQFGWWRRDLGWAMGLVALAGLTPLIQPHGPNVLAAKPLASFLDPISYPDSQLLFSRWDATSRVDVFESPGALLLWATPGSGRDMLPALRGITIDADALTAAARWDDGATALARRLPMSLPYGIAPRDRVLVIGPGGGLDVEAALGYGARRVDAVEINRGVVAAMLGPLDVFTNSLYRRAGVRLTVDDGRSFVRSAASRGEQYDAIVLTAVDSWAALTSGAYSLSESYLYTREAFDDYYDRLADGGVLAISRWFTRPPREMHRLAELARLAVEKRGGDPVRQVLILRAGQFGTFGTMLLRKGPFSAQEVTQARVFARDGGYGLVYEPGVPTGEFAPILSGLEPGAPDGRAATDDRPFFFDHMPWRRLLVGRGEWPLPQGHAVLLVALLQSICLAVAAVVLPLRRLATSANRLRPATAYFALIGLGFSLAEMALLQRALLLIGSPGIALAVVVGGMLGGAALGSALLSRTEESARRATLTGAVLLAGFALSWGIVKGPLAAQGVEGRAIAALVLAVVLAAPLGAALPAGLRRLPSRGGAVPWAWSINGAAAVAGTGLAVLLAMELGYTNVLVMAGMCYAGAGLLISHIREPSPVAAGPYRPGDS